jgi:beta-lactamase class A
MLDEAELSLRDLAVMMMSVSDNTATDVVLGRVGLKRVNDTLTELGLKGTELVGSSREIIDQLIEDVVGPFDPDVSQDELWQQFEAAISERALSARPLQAKLTSRSTPRETTELLSLIWTDKAASPEACAEVRRVLGLQVWPNRLRAGFPDSVKVASKTGTLHTVRNEAGVVEFPDGERFAVAVFTRTDSVEMNQPNVDHAIGAAAKKAIGYLRSLGD